MPVLQTLVNGRRRKFFLPQNPLPASSRRFFRGNKKMNNSKALKAKTPVFLPGFS
jgi:hypothetical protein